MRMPFPSPQPRLHLHTLVVSERPARVTDSVSEIWARGQGCDFVCAATTARQRPGPPAGVSEPMGSAGVTQS